MNYYFWCIYKTINENQKITPIDSCRKLAYRNNYFYRKKQKCKKKIENEKIQEEHICKNDMINRSMDENDIKNHNIRAGAYEKSKI